MLHSDSETGLIFCKKFYYLKTLFCVVERCLNRFQIFPGSTGILKMSLNIPGSLCFANLLQSETISGRIKSSFIVWIVLYTIFLFFYNPDQSYRWSLLFAKAIPKLWKKWRLILHQRLERTLCRWHLTMSWGDQRKLYMVDIMNFTWIGIEEILSVFVSVQFTPSRKFTKSFRSIRWFVFSILGLRICRRWHESWTKSWMKTLN